MGSPILKTKKYPLSAKTIGKGNNVMSLLTNESHIARLSRQYMRVQARVHESRGRSRSVGFHPVQSHFLLVLFPAVASLRRREATTGNTSAFTCARLTLYFPQSSSAFTIQDGGHSAQPQ